MRRARLVFKSVLVLLVVSLEVAAHAGDLNVSTPGSASGGASPATATGSAGTAFHYQIMPSNSPQSYSHGAKGNVSNRASFGTTKMSDSYNDNLVTTGTGANKTTDVFAATTVNITATITLDKSFDFSTIGATTPFSIDAGNYSFGAALDDADKFSLAAGSAIFVLTVDVTNSAGDTKSVATGRLTLKWSKKNRTLTIKVMQAVPAKLVSLGAEPAVTILSYPEASDGPINELVGVTVSFGDVTVDLEGSMVGSQKTVTKADGTTLVKAHAKCTGTRNLR